MNKELGDLDKTTEVLKTFKSRVGEEKESSIDDIIESMKTNDYDIDKTLVLSDLEVDKTLVLDKTVMLDKINEEANKISNEDVTKELEKGINHRKLIKKISLYLIFIPLIFIPYLIFVIIIGNHSHLLVTPKLYNIYIVILLCLFLIILSGIIMYVRNYRIIINHQIKNIYKKIYIIFMVIYTTLCITLITLFYGVTDIKDWIISTTINTNNLKDLPRYLYSQKEIDSALLRTDRAETGESTDPNYTDDSKESNEEYEKIIEKRDENTLYKVIQFKVNDCDAYLAIIYDASKLVVGVTKYLGSDNEYIKDIAMRYDGVVAINGGGYSSLGKPYGTIISNNKLITSNQYGIYNSGGLIGITTDNKLVLLNDITGAEALQKGVRDALSWGPFLIVNGNDAYTPSNDGLTSSARTAIGQRADGIILLLVVDSNKSRTKGANLEDIMKIMKQYGAINAASLDSGTSSIMYVNGEIVNHPIDRNLQYNEEKISTSFIVKK